jgi:hypothetical protein
MFGSPEIDLSARACPLDSRCSALIHAGNYRLHWTFVQYRRSCPSIYSRSAAIFAAINRLGTGADMSVRAGQFAAVTLAVALAATSSLADTEAAKVTADEVRAQGLPCAEPVSAQRDPAVSKPDEPLWILDCKDARYRVRLMGDMPAKVERLQ